MIFELIAGILFAVIWLVFVYDYLAQPKFGVLFYFAEIFTILLFGSGLYSQKFHSEHPVFFAASLVLFMWFIYVYFILGLVTYIKNCNQRKSK